jgi:serine/threonine protein kinase
MSNRIGQQLGNYQLSSLLGQGGAAEVYLGEHLHLGTKAAIKILHVQMTPQDHQQFLTEARTIATLRHPHIVRLLDFGVESPSGVPYLVMEYAPLGTLRDTLPSGSALPLPTILPYVKQVAAALQYVHDHKLIHRDVKPENMLLEQNSHILLSDFGIVVVAHSTRSRVLQDKVGTPYYMAPEQIQGQASPASDQYALAIVVYEWLCGAYPFDGATDLEIAVKQLQEPPPSLRSHVPSISEDVEWVVLKALAKDPQQRFASVQAFAAALEQACLPAQHNPIVSPSQPPGPAVMSTPLVYAQAPQSASQSASFASPLIQPRTRSVGGTILSVFFYLWGIFWLSLALAYGILSGILGLPYNGSYTGEPVPVVFVASCIVGIVILIFLLLSRKRLYLDTRRRFWLEIGLLLIGVLVTTFLSFGVFGHSYAAGDIFAGGFLVIYGLTAAFVAYW